MRNFSIRSTVLKRKEHELDNYADNILVHDGISFGLTGPANLIREFYSRMEQYIKITHIIGNHTLEENWKHNNIKFVQQEDSQIIRSVIDKTIRIICLERDRNKYDEYEKYWLSKGAVLNETFFQGEVFEAVYNVYAMNRIYLDRVEIFLTNCCTLNCEKCIAYIPYFNKKENTSLTVLKNDADLLFIHVDYINKLKLLGGEGFLYPYIKEYISYLYKKYGDKIGSIRIGTNGTIFPEDSVIKVCKDCNVIVDISDYRSSVPDKCRLEEVKQYFEEHGVKTDIKRTGEQWLDMGFPNNIPAKRTSNEEAKHFFECAMFCRQFVDGKFYFCCSNFAAVRVGLFKEDPNDFFDFHKNFSKKELLEFELGFSSKGHTSFCEVCNGCSEESNSMHVEVAKQAKSHLSVKAN